MRIILAILFLAVPGAAAADVSVDIRDRGLAGARADLEARAERGADEQFALAGLRFLEAIERAYVARYRHGLSAGNLPFPLFQGVLPDNPEPEDLRPETIRDVTSRFLDDMASVGAALDAIPDEADPVVVLNLPDLWFDVDADGSRGPREGMIDLVAPVLLGQFGVWRLEERLAEDPTLSDPRQASIRFDRSDVFWLAAYSEVLQGAAELVLAFDPTVEIAKVQDFQAAIARQAPAPGGMFSEEQRAAFREALRASNPDLTEAEIEASIDQLASRTGTAGLGGSPLAGLGNVADLLSIVIETLRHDPDPARIRKARDHFLAMIEENRRFWTALAAETDNENEWIPNPNQTAALGLDLPGEVGQAWLAVLDDMEAVLKGEKLIPFWRFAPGHGIDLSAYVETPAPLPIIDWAQGSAALPYAAEGEVLNPESWRAFEGLVRGQSGLMVILLN